MAIDWLSCFVVFILLMLARPVNEYPVARFFNLYNRAGWSADALYLAIGFSVFAIIISIIGVMIDRLRYDKRRPVNRTFVICGIFGLLAILVCVTLFATLLSV
jgi:hypothetical protein